MRLLVTVRFFFLFFSEYRVQHNTLSCFFVVVLVVWHTLMMFRCRVFFLFCRCFVSGGRNEQLLPAEMKQGLGKARAFFSPYKVPVAVEVTTLADRLAAVLGLEVRCSLYLRLPNRKHSIVDEIDRAVASFDAQPCDSVRSLIARSPSPFLRRPVFLPRSLRARLNPTDNTRRTTETPAWCLHPARSCRR